MGYIGRDNRVVSFTKQSLTANGSTTVFTLDQGVGDSSGILVSVGGVVQQPGVAYTVTGKTLTFSSAPGNGVATWVVYLGKELFSEKATVYGDSDSQIGVGNGTTTPLTLSHSVTNPQSIIVTLNGVAQVPTTDFTVSGTTLTFTTAPDSTNDITIYYLELESSATHIPDGSITAAKLANSGTLPAWNGSALTNLDAADLTGALPALDGSALTSQPGPIIKSASNPASNTNPNGGVGTLWLNHTTGQMYALTNAATNSNYWTNVGTGAGDIENNPPTNPNNTGSFASMLEGTSQNFIFSGATDPDAGDSVTHYHVDQISDGAVLSVSAASVAAGSAHTFTAGSVNANTNVTFRVRAKDSFGVYSSGVTVTATVTNLVYTVASSTNSTVGTSGNYKYHIFNQSGTFTVSQAGNDAGGVDYLVIAGGGAGGYSTAGGGGGAGGYRNSYNNETSGRGSSSETALTTMTASTYTITIGAGGTGTTSAGPPPRTDDGNDSSISGTGVSIISLGGGGGSAGLWSDIAPGRNGGSGGGGSDAYPGSQAGGSGTSNQGYDGGNAAGTNSTYTGGGGGGAGANGVAGSGGSGGQGGHGGAGLSSSITNSAVTRAGGGGGSVYNGTQGSGGSGGGGRGSQYTSNLYSQKGDINTGSGGGGGDRGNSTDRNGGSGIVVIRYRYQ